MLSRFLLRIGFMVFFMNSAFAGPDSAPQEKKAEGEVVCVQKDDQRKLWVHKEGDGCKVNYLKGGNITVIGSQKSGSDFCERLVEKVKNKLIGLGFEC